MRLFHEVPKNCVKCGNHMTGAPKYVPAKGGYVGYPASDRPEHMLWECSRCGCGYQTRCLDYTPPLELGQDGDKA